MARFPQGLHVSRTTCALLLVLLAVPTLATGSSEAQTGTMHNCPPAGNWSIAVWNGADGTAASDALATCGADSVAAAYSLDPPSGAWSRWFAGKPDVSNLPPLNDVQGLLALGSTTGPVPTPTPAATPVVTTTATPTATTGAPQSGIYRGTTSQGKSIEFDVAAGSQIISRIKFLVDGTCGEGCSCQGDVESNFGVTPVMIANGAFSHNVQEYDISGTFGLTTIAGGTLEYHHNGIGPTDPDCNSGVLTWDASLQ